MTEAINWQKSSFSGPDDNQSCIELAPVDGLIKLRESDDPRWSSPPAPRSCGPSCSG
ncbi:DUF397 domain-containing protein [Streptomyces sp. NPDC057554]|uniref:DUF397 domain-containing protein n=1 Tax=Streptomyces sp. NPDC057554 TaxID=3350538 RepID=UPI0036CE5D2B